MHPYSLRRLSWAGPVATISAIVANLIYFAATKAFGEEYLMPLDGAGTRLGPLPIALPVIVILISGLVASIFFAILIRFSPKPATVFLSVAITALILSFGGSFNLPTAALQTKILLSGMNILAAVIIAAGILWLSRNKNNPSSK
jgi:hypothetical protein